MTILYFQISSALRFFVVTDSSTSEWIPKTDYFFPAPMTVYCILIFESAAKSCIFKKNPTHF